MELIAKEIKALEHKPKFRLSRLEHDKLRQLQNEYSQLVNEKREDIRSAVQEQKGELYLELLDDGFPLDIALDIIYQEGKNTPLYSKLVIDTIAHGANIQENQFFLQFMNNASILTYVLTHQLLMENSRKNLAFYFAKTLNAQGLSLVLASGFNVNSQDVQGSTLLHKILNRNIYEFSLQDNPFRFYENQAETVKALAGYNPKLDIKNIKNISPIRMLDLYVETIPYMEYHGEQYYLTIPLAMKKFYLDLLNLATEDPDLPNERGTTLLMLAARSGDVERIQLLLLKTKNINLGDRNGNSALMHGIASGNDLMVRTLLKANANANQRNNKKQSPLTIAAEYGYGEIGKLIIDHGGKC